LNYDSVGGCPSLLLEPGRTNLIPNSVGGGTGYDTIGSIVVTNNFANSPNNTITSTRVNASAGVWRYRNASTTSLLPNTTYTFTVYVKSNTSENQTFRMLLYNATFSPDLVATTQWQRFTFTLTSLPTVTQIHGIGPGVTNNSADIQTWGWQIEQGSYPTSYIPTTTNTVTRVADSFTRNNIRTNNIITSAGGTWFVELNNNTEVIRDGGVVAGLCISDNLVTNGLQIWNVTGGLSRVQIRKLIALGGSLTMYTTTSNTCKLAIKWDGTNVNVFENGIKVVSNSSFNITNMDFLRCTNEDRPKYIKSMCLFPTPLTDAECIAITQ
jgi:hypothetical protein